MSDLILTTMRGGGYRYFLPGTGEETDAQNSSGTRSVSSQDSILPLLRKSWLVVAIT